MDLETAEKLMDSKAKPPGSLGALEFWAAQLCVIQGTAKPSLEYGSLLIFAGDHGVTSEGVAANPSAVTASIFATIASGKAASSVIAASQGVDLEVIDVGIANDVSKFYNDIAVNAKVLHTNSEQICSYPIFQKAYLRMPYWMCILWLVTFRYSSCCETELDHDTSRQGERLGTRI